MSQITTHVLDTTAGKPAEAVTAILYVGANGAWDEIGRGLTDKGGRIQDLLAEAVILQYGIYKIRFETKDYFDNKSVPTFYPFVEIIFDIQSGEHYHIPLLLSAYGYTTYRGS